MVSAKAGPGGAIERARYWEAQVWAGLDEVCAMRRRLRARGTRAIGQTPLGLAFLPLPLQALRPGMGAPQELPPYRRAMMLSFAAAAMLPGLGAMDDSLQGLLEASSSTTRLQLLHHALLREQALLAAALTISQHVDTYEID
mmetsp:Transcript_18730/g.61156  ORF Transcript_18730/g.61156 Transcript_18730/m.61156 type:complete len:142 (-) Transcript_18730:1178-1603(-)